MELHRWLQVPALRFWYMVCRPVHGRWHYLLRREGFRYGLWFRPQARHAIPPSLRLLRLYLTWNKTQDVMST